MSPRTVIVRNTLYKTDLANLAVFREVIFWRTVIQDPKVYIFFENKVALIALKKISFHDVIRNQT